MYNGLIETLDAIKEASGKFDYDFEWIVAFADLTNIQRDWEDVYWKELIGYDEFWNGLYAIENTRAFLLSKNNIFKEED